jgi:hypothetical protein
MLKILLSRLFKKVASEPGVLVRHTFAIPGEASYSNPDRTLT